jgi:DNA-binding transcriptional ArsR family regulator
VFFLAPVAWRATFEPGGPLGNGPEGRGSKQGLYREEKPMDEKKGRERAEAVREVLGHPLRVRIVSACSLRERTAAGLAEQFGVSVTTTSNHLRALVEGGWLRLRVETVRGVRKHFYRAARRAVIEDDEFAQMTPKQRRQLSEEVIRDFFRHTWKSWEAGTMDGKRLDSHFTWNVLQLDDQGWSELMTGLALFFELCIEIQADALVRLRESGETAIPTTVALAGFESPPQE